jgi:hypothetical protein
MRGKGLAHSLTPYINDTKLESAEDVPGIVRAATQYAVDKRVLDLATFDVTQNPLRSGALFDAIITDPPCTLYYGTVTMIVLTNEHRWRASRRQTDRPQKGASYACCASVMTGLCSRQSASLNKIS